MFTFLAATASAALLSGLIHLIIVLIVIAIIYYLGSWAIGKLGAPAMVATLWMILCVVIALYFIITFLLALVP